MTIKAVRILGVRVDRVTMTDALKLIEEFISDDKKHQICVPNVWTTVLAQKDAAFRSIYRSSSLSVPDGLPLVWASRLYGKPIEERVTGTDLFLQCAVIAAQKGYTFYFLGATESTLNAMTAKLKREYPTLNIAGSFSPPFSDEFNQEETNKIIDMVNRTKPDILWVGLTAPKQEKWIHQNLERLDVQIAVGIGAAFDFLSGRVRRAPLWVQKIGLEWFDRVLQEPKRLWKRYLVGNSLFVWFVIREFFRIKVMKKKPKT